MEKKEMAKAYAEGFAKEYREIAYDAFLCGYDAKCSTETPKDLEEYASRAGFDYVDDIEVNEPGHRWNDHDVEYAYRDGIIAGAKWQKVQLMKKAIDAEFCSAGMFMPMIDFKDKRMEGIKYGDTIKVIVIKEK